VWHFGVVVARMIGARHASSRLGSARMDGFGPVGPGDAWLARLSAGGLVLSGKEGLAGKAVSARLE